MLSLDSLDELLAQWREVSALLEPKKLPGELLPDTVRRLLAHQERLEAITALVAAKGKGRVEAKLVTPPGPLAGYKTAEQIALSCPGVKLGGLRAWLFRRNTNGLAEHVRMLGRKLVIDEAGFLRWLDAHGRRGRAA